MGLNMYQMPKIKKIEQKKEREIKSSEMNQYSIESIQYRPSYSFSRYTFLSSFFLKLFSLFLVFIKISLFSGSPTYICERT